MMKFYKLAIFFERAAGAESLPVWIKVNLMFRLWVENARRWLLIQPNGDLTFIRRHECLGVAERWRVPR